MIFLIFVVSLVVRILVSIAFIKIVNFDVLAIKQLGTLVLQGKNIFPSPANYINAFFPFYLYFPAIFVFLQKFGIDYMMSFKIFFSVIDSLIVFMVYRLSKNNLRLALYYALNPISILITSVQGQIDCVPLLLLLISIYFWQKEKTWLSLLSGSFAIAFKTWPIIFFMAFYKRLKDKKLIIILMIVPILFSLIYVVIFRSNLFSIIRTVLLYRGVFGGYGLGYVAEFISKKRLILQMFSAIFLIGFITYSYFQTRKKLIDQITNNLLFFFSFTPSIGIQWFMWLVPFLLIVKPKGFMAILICITMYLLITYTQWWCPNGFYGQTVLIHIGGMVTWLSILRAFLYNLKK